MLFTAFLATFLRLTLRAVGVKLPSLFTFLVAAVQPAAVQSSEFRLLGSYFQNLFTLPMTSVVQCLGFHPPEARVKRISWRKRQQSTK